MTNKIHCQYSELKSPKDLKPHPKNRNEHPKEQIDRLCKILKYQGWRYPVKVSKRSGFITSGHGRVLAAIELSLEQVPVSFQDYESEDQEYADVIADNSIASWSELDVSQISLDVKELGPDFDVDLLGLKDFVPGLSEKEFDPSITTESDKEQKTCPHCGEAL
jgi:ParB-like nuclease domain